MTTKTTAFTRVTAGALLTTGLIASQGCEKHAQLSGYLNADKSGPQLSFSCNPASNGNGLEGPYPAYCWTSLPLRELTSAQRREMINNGSLTIFLASSQVQASLDDPSSPPTSLDAKEDLHFNLNKDAFDQAQKANAIALLDQQAAQKDGRSQ